MLLLFEQLLNGLQLGVMLFLLAAGLTLVLGIMNDLLPNGIGETAFGPRIVMGAVLVGAFAERGADENDTDTVGGVIAGILSMVLLALGIVIAKQVLDDSDVFWATFVRVAAGVVTLAGIVALHPRRDQYIKELALSKAWLTALPASVCGNYVALLFWVAGMKYTTASRAGILNQMSTIFIFIMAAFILKERITKSKLAAITLALTGAVMTIFSN